MIALAIVALEQAPESRAPSVRQAIHETSTQKSYRFRISGDVMPIAGVYDNGCLYLSAGFGVEVVGKGAPSWGRSGGEWMPIARLTSTDPRNEVLPILLKMPPAHALVQSLAPFLGAPSGDLQKGFVMELAGNVKSLVRSPWVTNREIQYATTVTGAAQVRITTDKGLVGRLEVVLEGQVPIPEPPPKDPKPDDKNKVPYSISSKDIKEKTSPPPPTAPAKYKKVTIGLVVELEDYGTARIPEEARKLIGKKE